MSAYTHRCFQCEAKAAEIVALRENWAAAKQHAESLVLQMDAKDEEIKWLRVQVAELQQSAWIGSAGDMVD